MRTALRWTRFAVVLAVLPLAPQTSVQSAGVPTDGRWEEMSQPLNLHGVSLDEAGQRLVGIKRVGCCIHEWTLALGDSIWRPLPTLGPEPVSGTASHDPLRNRILMLSWFFGHDDRPLGPSRWEPHPRGPSWGPTGTPPDRRTSVTPLVYDSARDRMLLFGGDSSRFGTGIRLDDTWALSLSGTPTWSQVSTSGAPRRADHGMVYESGGDRLIVFGGFDPVGRTNETWGLDLASGTWSQILPAGAPPSPRTRPRIVYDTDDDRVLLFGGRSVSGIEGDTWTLTLDGSPTWLEHSMTPTPIPRSGPEAVFDASTGEMIIVGGGSALASYLESGVDSWRLDVDSGVATKVSPAGWPPKNREGGSGVYDPVGERFVVFGGRYWNWTTQVWAMDVHTNLWTFDEGTGSPPPGLQGHLLVYDSVAHRLLAFGGRDSTLTQRNDTWAYDLTTKVWTLLTPAGTTPAIRTGDHGIFDPAGNRLLLFGGNVSGTDQNDLWALDFSGTPTWAELFPTGGPPAARRNHVCVYDPIRHRMVMHGGEPDDTWALDLGTLTWANLAPTGGPPPERRSQASIYDSSRDRMVVFGGFAEHDDLWALDFTSNTWSELFPDGTLPEGRGNMAAAYDPIGDRMMIMNGNYNMPNGYSLWWTAPLSVGLQPRSPSIRLIPARPNPTSGVVQVDFTLPRRAAVDAAVYDVSGRLVRQLLGSELGAGRHALEWDGLDDDGTRAENGVYFVSVRIDGAHSARRVVRLD